MAKVKLDILRIINNSQPIFVECKLVDYNEISYYFIEKLPVVANYDSLPPCVGAARCKILETKKNTFVIDTHLPDDIESKNGKCIFEVYKNQVIV